MDTLKVVLKKVKDEVVEDANKRIHSSQKILTKPIVESEEPITHGAVAEKKENFDKSESKLEENALLNNTQEKTFDHKKKKELDSQHSSSSNELGINFNVTEKVTKQEPSEKSATKYQEGKKLEV